MPTQSSHKVAMAVASVTLLTGAFAYVRCDVGTPEGTWACKSQWTQERNGIAVPRSVAQQVTCANHVLSTTGVISIGNAQWSEKKKGTCYASGGELYGEWTSTWTAPKNDAARQFERERLAGKSLADASNSAETKYSARVTHRTETKFTAVDPEGRVIACARL